MYLDTDTLRYTSDTCISKRYTCIIGVCSTYVCIVLYRGWVEVHTCIIHMYRMYLHCILMYPHRLHRIHVFKCIWHVSDMYPRLRRRRSRSRSRPPAADLRRRNRTRGRSRSPRGQRSRLRRLWSQRGRARAPEGPPSRGRDPGYMYMLCICIVSRVYLCIGSGGEGAGVRYVVS